MPWSNQAVTSVTTRAANGAIAALNDGELVLVDSSGNTSLVFAELVGGTPYLVLIRGSATPVLVSVAGTIVGVKPGAPGTPEGWNTFALNAGFQALAGFAAPRYRYEPIGSGGQVRLDGALQLTANQAVGTAWATLPTHYQPLYSKYYLTGNSLSGGVGTEVESVRVINATGGGFLELGSSGSTNNYVLLEGITFPLD